MRAQAIFTKGLIVKFISFSLSAVLLGILPLTAFSEEIVPCTELPESILNSDIAEEGYICEAYIPSNLSEKKPSDDNFLSVDGKTPTRLIYRNKGGYVSWITVDYRAADRNGRDRNLTVQSPTLFAGQKWSYSLPADAHFVKVRADLQSGLGSVWPIFESKVYDRSNIDLKNDNSSYVIQWDVWNTTLYPKYAQVTPSGTYRHDHHNIPR